MSNRGTDYRRPIWERIYLPLALLLIGFGIVALASIGFPFLILGSALALLWPLRHRPAPFKSILLGVSVFVVVAVLISPLQCTASDVADTGPNSERAGRTTCGNLLGLDYEGTTGYNPPLWPAPLAGATAGAMAAAVTYVLLRRGRRA